MHYQHITSEMIEGAICILTLSRPESANALNRLMAEELAQALKAAGRDDFIRVIILTGRGSSAFCAGADLKERKGMNREEWQLQHLAFEHALQEIMHCTKPIIAAVNGAAIGGGLELTLACDFIYASDNAKFGLTEATLGIMPGMGGTQNLPRAIGMRSAKELLFTGKIIDAKRAYELGLVNRMYEPDTLRQEALATAKLIADNAPLSVRHIKRAIDKGIHENLEEAMQTELALYHTLLDTKDRSEGINAFNEKRKAKFTGN